MSESILRRPVVENAPSWLDRAFAESVRCAGDPGCMKIDCGHTDGDLHLVPGPIPEYLCAACFERRALGPEPAAILPIVCVRCDAVTFAPLMSTEVLDTEREGPIFVHARLCRRCVRELPIQREAS